MTEKSVYECNLTGETIPDETEVLTVPLRRHARHPFSVHEQEIHLSKEELEERLPRLARPHGFGEKGFVGIEYGDDGVEVVGYCIPYTGSHGRTVAQYEERDAVVGDHYEPFFELLESDEVFLL